jgi:hypothetical protein
MGHVACMGEIRNIFKILVKKLKWKRLLEIVSANARRVWKEERSCGRPMDCRLVEFTVAPRS